MKTLKEWMEAPDAHPFHQTALNNGFSHSRSSSVAHMPTHEYTHKNGHTLSLHRTPEGPSFRMKSKSGQETTGNTAMRLHGAMLQAK